MELFWIELGLPLMTKQNAAWRLLEGVTTVCWMIVEVHFGVFHFAARFVEERMAWGAASQH